MPHYIFEARAAKTIAGLIAGVDEAGRGPLAGPVVAAAVILDRKRIPKGLNDSKQMTAEAREEAYFRIMACAVVGVGEASVDEIDLVNIRQATHFAMARAITTSIAPGSSARSSVTAGGASLRCACINEASFSRRNGGCPVRHSNNTAPSEYTSVRASSRRPRNCSGAA